ncbi:concanavalin A-like lectin/glucanase domain-containing protein [Bombardia bombarda]|uniref:Concanavalin A-like lectin/glucanase domain-containing protein n=1 Tax=Bombardia bombarda TaxID=252184 RepID=A0AA39WIB0_9PEZI|nr:concanavalin A-like lectin/glucanase domain-containing protein [Bombardia bombarda]
MKPATALAPLLLSTTTSAVSASASGGVHHRSSTAQTRLSHHRAASPPTRVSSLSSSSYQASIDSTQGGAYFLSPADTTNNNNNNITIVSGSFIVPAANVPTAGPTANNPVLFYAASFWIGIDGAWLRAGIDISYDGAIGGPGHPFAWYQWHPAEAVGFANFTVAPGDRVHITAIAGSPSSSSSSSSSLTARSEGDDDVPAQQQQPGGLMIQNFGPPAAGNTAPLQTAMEVLSGPPLCQRAAGWIIEDFPVDASNHPELPAALVDFGAVSFADMDVTMASKGSQTGVAGVAGDDVSAAATVVDVQLAAQGGG